MQIAASLVQHYFLEVDPRRLDTVAETLLKAERPRQTGEWRLFSWLDRSALWAMRAIERTSGLDTFLFDDDGLPGVTDVAEIITFPMQGGEADCLLPDWEAFASQIEGEGVLFSTFLWPAWDTLCCPHTWGGNAPPHRTQILEAIRCCLIKALPKARERGLLSKLPPLLLTASAGDADLILYGWIKNSQDLDGILLALSVMETDALAAHLKLGKVPKWPVFRSSQTELALELSLFQEVRRTALPPGRDDGLKKRLDDCFQGELFAEVGLARGRGSLSSLKDGLKNITEGWEERAVFGGEDLVLAAKEGQPQTFGEVVTLLARLEMMYWENSSFPRRSSLRLGVMSAMGRTFQIRPSHIYGGRSTGPAVGAPPESLQPSFQSVDLSLVRKAIGQLAGVRWREDVRIIERMIERCVTLQKSPSLRRETRRMVAHTLIRIVRSCEEIGKLEAKLDEQLQKSESPVSGTEREKQREKLRQHIRQTCIEIRIRRNGLLNAGMALDGALCHHSRGVVALLLHPASQARGAEHIGSEVGLSFGMSAMFQSAARRMLAALPAGGERPEDGQILYQIKEALRDIQHPTIYASHDPDFAITASMALLRIPRWALWYPSASSHLMHEFGHALASIGSLSYLLTAVLREIGGYSAENAEVMRTHLNFITRLLKSGEATLNPLVLSIQRILILNKDTDCREVQAEFGNELEEISCDVVARCMAYPSGAGWDHRWLVDAFEYCLPLAGRHQPDFIRSHFLRLRAAYTVVQLLRKGLLQDGSKLKPFKLIETEINDAAREFGKHLKNWREGLKHTPRPLPRYVSRALDEVLPRFLNGVGGNLFHSSTQDTQEIAFLYAGIVISLALSTRPVEDPAEVSAFKSTQIWARFADMIRQDETAENDAMDRVVQALTQNRIPESRLKRIEYLPSILAKHFEQNRNRVPPSVRIALSFYLYDNYDFDNLLN